MNERWVCKRCFADNEGTSTSCARCGQPRDAAGFASTSAPAHQPAGPPGPPEPEGWRRLLRFAWIPVLAVVLVAGYVAYSGQRALEELAVGQCFDAAAGAEIDEVDLKECDAPHEYEVFYVGEISGDTYPTDAELDALFAAECAPAFADYVGAPYETSELWAQTISPSEESWDDGDREYTCSLYDPDEPALTSSMRGANR